MTKHTAQYRIADLDKPPFFHAGLEFSAPARGGWTIAHTPLLIPGCLEIFVCPEGCLRGVVLSAAESRAMDRFAMVTLKENDLYDGRMEELFIDGVSDILAHKEGDFSCVMVYTSCVQHFTAIDLGYILRVLQERYPNLDFIENYMNCTMRKSKLHFEEMTTKQIYAPLKNVPKDPKAVNIIGNYFALDLDSEILRIFEQAGWMVRDLCWMETYEEYLDMSEASYNVYTMPVAKECVQELEKRLGQEPFYLPYTWDTQEIEQQIRSVVELCGGTMPRIDRLTLQAEKALSMALRVIKDTPIQIDYSATPRPLGLAKLLLEHGFHVQVVYMDTLLPQEEEAFAWIKERYPDLLIRATIDFRCRRWARDDVKKAGGRLLAIGQKAAYYSGTNTFVNLIANDGLHGFVGIRKLAQKMVDAMLYPKDTEQVLSVKARGCLF